MNYGPLQELIEDVQEEFVSQSFFWEENGEARSTQKGVFRTNCKDCLDRTNVVQTKFARVVLASKLRHLGVLVEKQEVHEVPSLEVCRKPLSDRAQLRPFTESVQEYVGG